MAASKKTVAKKAPAKKAAPPAKKAAATKAPAKKAASPAKKAATTKAPAKKIAPPAKKTEVKKASPAKTVQKPAQQAAAKSPVKSSATKQTSNKNVVTKPAPEKEASKGSSSITQRQGMTTNAKESSKKASKKEKRMDSLFEATQAAPKSIAPKVDEIPPPPVPTVFATPEPVKPKPNVRYSDKDLKEFAKVIESEKEKTLDELRMLKERLEDLTNYEASEETAVYSMHMAEQGSEAVEREKTYAQIQRTTDYLRKLDDSMKRIEDKTYGICRQCGILIARERLLAVPITTLSASWKLRQRCPDDGTDRIGK